MSAGVDSNNNLQHWSQLTAEDQIRFWQSVDQGDMSS
ncbi:replication initiation protein, partial [Salmonella enterica]|nr:replication initiation protein [Salmonella enterica]